MVHVKGRLKIARVTLTLASWFTTQQPKRTTGAHRTGLQETPVDARTKVLGVAVRADSMMCCLESGLVEELHKHAAVWHRDDILRSVCNAL